MIYGNLKTLFLDHNLTEDLSPLRALAGLTYLQAIGNPSRKRLAHMQQPNADSHSFPTLRFRQVHRILHQDSTQISKDLLTETNDGN